MAEIRLERVTKLFGDVRAVDDVDLTIRDGEFMVLLGPSGCGKTTLLRSIAGLEQIDTGRVRIGERDVTDLPPRKRRIAMARATAIRWRCPPDTWEGYRASRSLMWSRSAADSTRRFRSGLGTFVIRSPNAMFSNTLM